MVPSGLHDVVVIGASAGGVEALTALVAGLPADLPAAVFVVLHMSSGPSMLPAILARRGPLPAEHAIDRQPIEPGRIYVAPPDFHLLVCPEHVGVSHGPRENRSRPSVDVLFRSAATSHTARVVGVVLSGNLDDGAAGLVAIKRCGGLAVVQDPSEARCSSMPQAALLAVDPDRVAPMAEIGQAIAELVRTPAGAPVPVPTDLALEAHGPIGSLDQTGQASADAGPIVEIACPECGGALHEQQAGPIGARYRCYLGHVYSTSTLLASHGDEVERALWASVRVLRERAKLYESLARDQDGRGMRLSGEQYRLRARELMAHAAQLRGLLGLDPVEGSGERPR